MIADLGLIDYEEAYNIQKDLVARRKLGEVGDSLLVAEHKRVFTIGRSGHKENLLVDEESLRAAGIKVIYTDRGGDITFHNPGQIVLYPIIDLKNRLQDLHRYLRDLEEVVILFLNEYGIIGTRRTNKTGVWIGDRKIASIGIGASNWITYHGLSLNINNELGYFLMINPCGMKGVQMTSLRSVMDRNACMDTAKKNLLRSFNEVFNVECAGVA